MKYTYWQLNVVFKISNECNCCRALCESPVTVVYGRLSNEIKMQNKQCVYYLEYHKMQIIYRTLYIASLL